VITISRQYASGGDEIAAKVSRKLGYALIDKEIISHVAGQVGLPQSELEKYDEKAENPIFRFLFRLFSSEKYITYIATGTHFRRDKLPEFITSTIVELYQRGNLVIIGRGAQAILKDKPRTIHIRIVCPFEVRCRKLMELEGISLDKVASKLKRIDKQREGFLRQCFNINPDDPSLYHLIINTAKVREDQAVDMITMLARQTSLDPIDPRP